MVQKLIMVEIVLGFGGCLFLEKERGGVRDEGGFHNRHQVLKAYINLLFYLVNFISVPAKIVNYKYIFFYKV